MSEIRPIAPWSATLAHTLLHAGQRCAGDRHFLRAVTALAFRGKPRARRSWRWYQQQAGQPLAVSTDACRREDRGLRAWVAQQVSEARANGITRGRVWVDQRRLSSRDWRYALGSYWVDWQQTGGDRVTLRITGRYDWAPHQPRITRAIHAAAASLKRSGAAAFAIEGEPVTLERSELRDAGQRTLVCHRALI